MDRRELLGALGATAAGLAAVTGGEARAQEAKKKAPERGGPEFHPEWGHHTELQHRCAEACARCMHECEDGFNHCLRQVRSGQAEYARAAHLCIDCAEVCGTAAKLVARGSPLMVHTCAACAAACEDCLGVCEKLDDPEMKLVVESLRAAAKSCREMVQAMSRREGGTR